MKNKMPLVITQLHVDNMLEYDTNWINNKWDGNKETLRAAIKDGDYNDYPYMLYEGNRAQRHELHRKLGTAFSHSSMNMDDGSRIMIIINQPGYIHTQNDLSICFFTLAVENVNIRAELALADAERRGTRRAAQTLDSRRERANLLIGHPKPETQEEYEKRIAAEELSKSEPEDVLSDASIPLHKVSSDQSLNIAKRLLFADLPGALDLARKSGVSQYSDSLEGRLLQGDVQKATQLAMQRVLDANMKAMQERMNARAEAWSEMSEPPPQPPLERHETTASLCGNE